MDKKYQIGNFIMALRQEKGFTQKQLADRLNVSNRTVSSWETGSALPRFALMEQLSKLLNVTPAEIMAGERLSEQDGSYEQRKQTYKHVRERIFTRCESCSHSKPLFCWPNRDWTCPKCRAGLSFVPKGRSPYAIAAAVTVFVMLMIWQFLPRPARFEILQNGYPARAPAAVTEFFETSAEWSCAYLKDSVQYALEIFFYVLAFASLILAFFVLISSLLSRLFCKIEVTSYPYPDGQSFDL